MKWKVLLFGFVFATMLSACNASPAAEAVNLTATPLPEPTATSIPSEQAQEATSLPPAASDAPILWAVPAHRLDGNRLVEGQGRLPDATPRDLSLNGTPNWVVAAPLGDDTLWVVVLNTGEVQAFRLNSEQVQSVALNVDQLPAGMPPLLRMQGEQAELIVPPEDASNRSHPTPLPDGRLVYVAGSGDLVIWDGETELGRIADLNLQPDARLLVDEAGRILTQTQATDRYAHGIMGDDLEGGEIALFDQGGGLLWTVGAEPPFVFEAISPIWEDLNNDGQRDIVATRAGPGSGAQLVVFDERGDEVATGEPIGQGNRWRHKIAVGPFGPNGEVELVDVLTPHLGRVAEFFQWQGDRLVRVADVPGYTTHIIGSPNLDMGIAGDFNGDGQIELVAMNPDSTELAGIQRTVNGAAAIWQVPVGGRISSNLAAVQDVEGRLWLAVGHRDGVLRIWGTE
ncbi:MAG: hypothetical protein GYB68_10290 [Chloroflexi bacterium]|nr:hypothetical protein [Chloroflexota bacterium]